jgi:hypothetical protein
MESAIMEYNKQLKTIEDYKVRGRYRTAGQTAALLGHDDIYGCHFGMRSTRDFAMAEYKSGHAEIRAVYRRMERGA